METGTSQDAVHMNNWAILLSSCHPVWPPHVSHWLLAATSLIRGLARWHWCHASDPESTDVFIVICRTCVCGRTLTGKVWLTILISSSSFDCSLKLVFHEGMFLHFTLLPPPHLLALMQLCVGYTENQLLSSTSGTLSSFKDDSPAKELKICLCREEFIWKISPRVCAVLVIDLLCTFKICISFFIVNGI